MTPPLPKEYWDVPSQDYGISDPVTYPQTGRHIGVDFPTPFGAPLVAPTDCEITRVGYSNAIGFWCEVRIEDWYMVALHLKARPKVGTYKQGETLGHIGASGKIKGIHSHLEGWTIPMDRASLTKTNWNMLTFNIKSKFV